MENLHVTPVVSADAARAVEAVRAQILGVLQQHPELKLAILFGSRARGTARADSDVDLAVSAGCPLRTDELMSLIGDLGAAIGRPVDLVDLATVGEPLLGQILMHGARLLGDSSQQAVWLTRHLVEKADFVPLQRRILAERRRQWIGS